MVSTVWLSGLMLACSPVHRIPAPEPPPSTVPPSAARAHYLRGQISAAGGDLDSAEYSLNRARIFDSSEPRILMALGAVSMTRGDMEQARKRFSDAANMSSNNPEPWLAHGRIELAFGSKDVGRSALRHAMRLGDSWEARSLLISDMLRTNPQTGIPDELVEWVASVTSDPDELRRRADLRLRAGDPLGSVDDYIAAIRISSRDLSLVGPLVRASSIGGVLAYTLISLDQILENDERSMGAWMAMGMLSSLVGDHEQTIVGFEAAERMGATLGKGALQAVDSARQARQAVGLVSTTTDEPVDPMGRALWLLQQQQWDASQKLVANQLAADPDDHHLLYIMAQIHLERDGPAAATSWVVKLVEKAPMFAPGLNLWAWVHAEQGMKLSEAEQYARAALRQQPRIGDYWDTLGVSLMRQEKYKEAMPIMDRAVRFGSNDGAVRARRDSCRALLEGTRE